MSVYLMSLVWQADFGTPARKLIAMRLADFSNDNGDNIFPTVGRVADDCGVDRTTVQRILRGFLVEGLLHVIEPGGQNGKGATHYRLDIKRLEGLAGGRTVQQRGPRQAARGAATDGPGGPRQAAHNHQEQPPREPESPLSPQEAPQEAPQEVTFDGRTLTLGPGERTFWLEQFGGDGPRLDLALVTAAGYVQRHSSRPLLVQVRAQLARAAADKRDRDSRYAVAAKSNGHGQPSASKAIFDRVLGRVPA